MSTSPTPTPATHAYRTYRFLTQLSLGVSPWWPFAVRALPTTAARNETRR